ncbi:MAG: DUF1800 family protein [Planctomycetota bacterium]
MLVGHRRRAAARPRPLLAAAVAAAVVVPACSSGIGDPYAPGADLPASETDALRFLQRATFGPDEASLQRLQYLGYDTWLREQQELPASLQEPALQQLVAGGASVNQSNRQEVWWRHAVRGRDQLRQRVAFALSEIFVVSDQASALSGNPIGLAHWYDMLARNAFGDYRTLLEQVTLHPVMGQYLSMLRNRKPDPSRNIRPDENNAREVMQLFSIGLSELLPDGTPRLDLGGDPIPTYTQSDIEALAHVFTGWTYAGSTRFTSGTPNNLPMVPFEDYHDRTQKDWLGEVFPAGVDARTELTRALDVLAAHPNVGPFLGRQLIQRLVTSNPSPAYVARVAAVWADDGQGARGNLGAVVRAILLDDEAMRGHVLAPGTFGKLREGLLQQTAIWRVFGARAQNGQYAYSNPQDAFGQAALRADTVFNFFRPDHRPQGELTTLGLDAPEFQVLDQNTAIAANNQLYRSLVTNHLGRATPAAGDVLVDLGAATALADDPDALLDWLDRWLLAGAMTPALRQVVRQHLVQLTDPMQRAREGAWLVATSPQFAVQK